MIVIGCGRKLAYSCLTHKHSEQKLGLEETQRNSNFG